MSHTSSKTKKHSVAQGDERNEITAATVSARTPAAVVIAVTDCLQKIHTANETESAVKRTIETENIIIEFGDEHGDILDQGIGQSYVKYAGRRIHDASNTSFTKPEIWDLIDPGGDWR